MTTPDIQVGDLVKATHRAVPEHVVQGRIRRVTSAGVTLGVLYPSFHSWDFEVLDRPLPPIDEELLQDAVGAYFGGMGYTSNRDASPRHRFGPGVTAVINFVREHDKNNTKENA